jgi:hypothetical protein
MLAAQTAVRWAGDAPLVLGGDFNLRPRETDVFERLAREYGLGPPTAPDALDHLLARGVDVIQPPFRWPAERRELAVPCGLETRRLRLSDHAPVEATYAVR